MPPNISRLPVSLAACFLSFYILSVFNLNIVYTEEAKPAEPPKGKPFTYKTSYGKPQVMEIYFPEGHDPCKDKRPGVLLFHGGGWGGGDLSQFRFACHYFASRGLVCATANYFMMPKNDRKKMLAEGKLRKGVCVTDGKSALRWFKQNADKLGIDAERIITGGGSAGAHISLLASVDTNAALDDPNDPKGIDTSAIAYLLFNPAIQKSGDKDKLVDFASHLTKDFPPSIAVYGEKDIKWKAGWDEAHTKLKQLGAGDNIEVWVAPEMGHGFFNKWTWRNNVIARMDKFLNSIGILEGEPTLLLTDAVLVLECEK